jgi:hypothetical protein
MTPTPIDNVSAIMLAIANIRVRIICNDRDIYTRLYERYRVFLDNPALHAQFEILICLDAALQPAPLHENGIVFDPQTRRFITPGSEGILLIETGSMHLRISPRQPITDVDHCLRIIYALLAAQNGGILFHAAGIVRNDAAFIFFGHSGSGKTTVARLSTDCTVLNDDLVLLLPHATGWTVHATPFWNPTQFGLPRPGSAPLTALLRLVQARHVAVEQMSPAQALAEIISCIPVVVTYANYSRAIVQRSLQLVEAVPTCRLHFRRDPSFWQAIESTMDEQCIKLYPGVSSLQ